MGRILLLLVASTKPRIENLKHTECPEAEVTLCSVGTTILVCGWRLGEANGNGANSVKLEFEFELGQTR